MKRNTKGQAMLIVIGVMALLTTLSPCCSSCGVNNDGFFPEKRNQHTMPYGGSQLQ